MKTIQEEVQFSEQDYGPYIDRATLVEHEGSTYLHVECGYSKPYESAWYKLDGLPCLKTAFGGYTGLWFDPSRDESLDLTTILGVTAVKVDTKQFGW